jgi:hypothetical protein
VTPGPGVGVAFGGAVGVGVGLPVGAAVGRVTGVLAGTVGVGRRAIPPPDGVGVAEPGSDGPADGSADPAGGDGSVEGGWVSGDPVAPGPDGVTAAGVDGPAAMPFGGSSGAPIPTAKANAARTRLRTPRATTRRAR